MGPSWNFKFRDFTSQFFHIDEFTPVEDNPVEQHNNLLLEGDLDLLISPGVSHSPAPEPDIMDEELLNLIDHREG